ncbi:unnamed protein product [Protopolystoma xenopodis]|uniref:Uncharacterized protein n=1 Tax=Protopolystoma xenopodis TaxID=117903 RepID=A0A448X1C9_9PLAT|nr:unnamed protein product [Protopolystoma xenopodis]
MIQIQPSESQPFVLFLAVVVIDGNHGYSISIMIKKSLDVLTIVIPPALPAVMTTSLFLAQIRLRRHGIFCINPSAINLAGTLDTVVFDKVST